MLSAVCLTLYCSKADQTSHCSEIHDAKPLWMKTAGHAFSSNHLFDQLHAWLCTVVWNAHQSGMASDEYQRLIVESTQLTSFFGAFNHHLIRSYSKLPPSPAPINISICTPVYSNMLRQTSSCINTLLLITHILPALTSHAHTHQGCVRCCHLHGDERRIL